MAILALACKPPEQFGRPVTHWTAKELALEVIQQGIVSHISERTMGRLLEEADLKPHRSRYWLNSSPDDPEAFKQVHTICELYGQAEQLVEQGTHLLSTDEKTVRH